jgi:putative ABC transport system permease protein
MTTKDLFYISYRNLTKNKVRSGLTMLGVIIGVASVIGMVAVTQGTRTIVEEQISNLGANMIVIFPRQLLFGGVRSESAPLLTIEDAEAIRRDVPFVTFVSPFISGGFQAVYTNRNRSSVITGVTPDFQYIRNWNVLEGHFFSEKDVRLTVNVCVLGKTVVNQLFGLEDPIGKTVLLKHVPFRVIGTMTPKGQTAFGQDQDDMILAPVTTVMRKLAGETHISLIFVSVTHPQVADLVIEQMQSLLRQRGRLLSNQEDGFQIKNVTEIIEVAAKTAQVFSLLLALVASISLLVGGIGIMNIMLVSVTERTKEIGIRMAIGATPSDILRQFLVESLSMSLLGGIIGIGLGLLATTLLCYIFHFTTKVSLLYVAISFIFSGLVGVLFGMYPAYKASRLRPVEALRHE